MNITEWDIICVGAGITSLAFAAQLVKRNPGIRILIVEKHFVPGGYASTFDRPKQAATFDCSLHKLTGMTGQGNLKRMLDDLHLSEELEFFYPNTFFQASLKGKTVVLPSDADIVKQTVLDLYPEDEKGIHQFFADIEQHGKNSYFQFQMMAGTFDVETKGLITSLRYAHKNLKGITVKDALSSLFSSQELREVLALPAGYVGAHPEDISYLYFLHVMYATFYCGNAYIRGGSQRLSDALVKRIEAAGGQVMLRTRVEKILVDSDNRVTGIETNRGTFTAPQVYINAAPHYVMNHLFDPELPLDDAKKKLDDLKPSWSTLTLYVVIDGTPADYDLHCTETFLINALNDEAHLLRQQAAASGNEQLLEHAYWSASPIEITNYHAMDPDSGSVLIFNLLDSIDHWPERRTPEYKQKKKRANDIVLNRFFERFPAFRGHIKYSEVSTPRTCVRYTNNTVGAGFGALVGTELNPHIFHHNFPIAGAYFMSSWVAGPGYEAAFGFSELKAMNWKPEKYVPTRQSNQQQNQQFQSIPLELI